LGFSFGELVVLAVLALIVIGPKDLPKLLRTAGRTIGQIKRVVSDVRKETGLDEVLRGDFEDLVRLADHIERIDETHKKEEPEQLSIPNLEDEKMRREREYPRIGPDNYAMLSEDAPVYGDLPTYASEEELPKVVTPEGVVSQGDEVTT
jgi:sec-independent protein translocase protein TatB